MSLKLIHFSGLFLVYSDLFKCQIMEYSPTLCFTGFNSKAKKFQKKKKIKRAIAAVYVTTEFCVSRKKSKQIAKELCHDSISSVATQRSKY